MVHADVRGEPSQDTGQIVMRTDCSAKCGGAQSPGSIEMSHKAEAIKRGQAFLKLNIFLVGYSIGH